MASYDIIGDIAIVKFNKGEKKKNFVRELLKQKNIKVVLEKADRIKGRLRTAKMNYLGGEKRKETLYKENGCKFLLNVETCYFSSRLSEERKRIAGKIKWKDRVLVMFGGVAPFSIVIAKLAKPREVVSIEISRACNIYAKKNVILNKTENVKIIQGDVKRIIKKGGLIVNGTLAPLQFDKIVMARPNLNESFFKYALNVSRKGTIIYYYGFCHVDEKEKMLNKLLEEAKKEKRKIKIKRVTRAGDIAPYKYRYRVEIGVLN